MHVLAPDRVRVAPRERRPHLDDAQLLPLLEVRVPIEEVLARRPAPEEQQRLHDVPARPLLHGALLQEAAHRREPRARREHDHRDARVLGRVERGGRGAHGELDDVPRAEPREEVGRDAEEGLRLSGQGWRLDDADRERRALRVVQWGGRDGVLPDAHRGEHLEVRAEGQLNVRVFLEDLEDADPCDQNLLRVGSLQVLNGSLRRVGRFDGQKDAEIASGRRL